MDQFKLAFCRKVQEPTVSVSHPVMSASATPWTVARRVPLSMEVSKQRLEWLIISTSRGSFHPGIEPGSPALQVDSLPSEPRGKTRSLVPSLGTQTPGRWGWHSQETDRESGKGWHGKVSSEEGWEEREQGEMTVNSHLRVHSGPERVLPGDREGDRGGETQEPRGDE